MQKITSKTFYEFRYVSDVRLSPFGSRLAFMVKQVRDRNGYDSMLYICEDGYTRELPCGKEVSGYVWDEDDSILFSALMEPEDRERKKRGEYLSVVYRLTLGDGKISRAFELPVKAAKLTRIGKDIYLVCGKYRKPQRDDGKPGTVTMLTEVPYWGEFGEGFTNGQRSRLYLFDAAAGKLEPITGETFQVIQYSYSEGTVAITGMDYDSKATKLNGLYAYDVRSRMLTELVPQDKMYIYTCASFGENIMFMGNESTIYDYQREYRNFFVMPASGGEYRMILEHDYNVGGGNLATDATMGGGQTLKRCKNRLYYLSTRINDIGLYSIDLEGNWRAECSEAGCITSFDIADNRMVVCALREDRLCELYEKGVQLTHLNDRIGEEYCISTPIPETVAASDGFEVYGWVMKPVEYENGKRYPAILHIHGGPPIIFSSTFYAEQQVWANHGYFVFFCNPRGSDGRGTDFRYITGGHGDWDYHSIMDWFEGALKRYPEVDQSRLGLTGGSYGGFMTNWIITQTDRFAAAVSQRSISNWISFEYTAIRGWWLTTHKFGVRAGQNAKPLWDSSPLKYAESCRTPTLFIQSDNDHVCSLDQALCMYAALKIAGCETKMCIFHGEDHALSRIGRPENRIRSMNEILEWFDEHLKQ